VGYCLLFYKQRWDELNQNTGAKNLGLSFTSSLSPILFLSSLSLPVVKSLQLFKIPQEKADI
jgi:hypothetical protein